MHNLPLEFKALATANSNFNQTWTINSGANQAVCAIPPEFGGDGGGFSPEDLFLQAAINCFVGTFKVIAKLSKISFELVQVNGTLIVDKNEGGKVVMKKIHFEISLSGVDRPERIETVVSKTIKDGFILNSIKSEVTHSLEFNL